MTPDDYRGQHQPDPGGVRLHDAGAAFPDVYERPELYHHFNSSYDESLAVLQTTRNRPHQKVTVYRAIPPGWVRQIHTGDWVTLSRAYAEQHAMQDDDPTNDWPIVSEVVQAEDLTTEGNDVNEWGFFPLSSNGRN